MRRALLEAVGEALLHHLFLRVLLILIVVAVLLAIVGCANVSPLFKLEPYEPWRKERCQ